MQIDESDRYYAYQDHGYREKDYSRVEPKMEVDLARRVLWKFIAVSSRVSYLRAIHAIGRNPLTFTRTY